MMTIRELISGPQPLLLPAAHDAVTARLIERAGFPALFISGFGVAGFQFGLPDLGLVSFGEMAGAFEHIAGAVSIPILADGDDGYGDVKNVTRTVRRYEAMGLAGIVLEDQLSPKKCGHTSSRKRIAPLPEAERKLLAALAARSSDDDFIIVARTDARSVEGLDAALERGRRYAGLGVDALFIEAPASIDELEQIGRSFDLPLLVNAAEGGRTPILSSEDYKQLGFSIILYPGSLMPRIISVVESTLACLLDGHFPQDKETFPPFSKVLDVMGMGDWLAIEDRFDPA